VGEVIEQRLAQVYAQLPAPGSELPAPRVATTSISYAPVVPPMDMGRSGHGALGVLIKRGIDSLLRYHTHYQADVNVAFASFMRELEAENKQLRARVDALSTRLENLTRDREPD
jgi:hypothetical protein